MKTLLILAAGVWIGRQIYTTLAQNQAREREVTLRKKLDQFIRENLPAMQAADIKQSIDTILKQ
ncbi:MAG: hypothetical protein JST26_05525 [Bacteroidetes bacterium]|nr:hypothetical protein [Bacteroidota bacterium]